MSSRGKIGIVTVTYNSVSVLEPFLKSVGSQTYGDFLLYAVDNSSRDRSVGMLQAWGDPRLRLIVNPRNEGVAEGNNQGTRMALADGCEFVLYLNNDVEFDPGTLEAMVSELLTLPCDMLAPKIVYGDQVRIWAAGGGFNPVKGYMGFHTGMGEPDRGQFEQQRKIAYSPTCCLLVKKHVFDNVGLMDSKYFAYYDDLDFCFRAWRAGFSMYYTPAARIIHKVSSLTGGSDSPFTIRYNARNQVYFILKNLGLARSLYYLPALELRLLFKALSGVIGGKEFRIRQRAFFEGFRVWRGKNPAQPEHRDCLRAEGC